MSPGLFLLLVKDGTRCDPMEEDASSDAVALLDDDTRSAGKTVEDDDGKKYFNAYLIQDSSAWS